MTNRSSSRWGWVDRHSIFVCDRLEVLGALVTADQWGILEHRLTSATFAFWKFAKYLRCPGVAIDVRVRVFSKRVVPIVLFGIMHVRWMQTTVARVVSWENSMLRLLWEVRCRPAEPFEVWRQRYIREARRICHTVQGSHRRDFSTPTTLCICETVTAGVWR